MSLVVALCALLGALACAPASGEAAVVLSGHREEVNVLRYDAQSSLLFSGGGDGLLVAWDVAKGVPAFRLPVSHLPIRQLAVHPSLPQVAVVESDLTVTRFSVWNYREGRRLFLLELDMPPSFVAYSSTGRYLVVCRERYDSLLLLDPATGERLPLFVGGFGIVSFVTFGPDDTLMMSYQPGGEVRYWDVASQSPRFKSMTTEPLLGLLALSGSEASPKDSLVGSTGRTLVLADILRSGSVKERLAIPDIISIASSGRGEVVCLSRSASGVLLSRLRYSAGGGFLRLGEETLGGAGWPGGTPTVVALGPTGLYVGCGDGAVVSVPVYSSSRLLGRNEIGGVSDVALVGGVLLVATPGTIHEYDVGAAERYASGDTLAADSAGRGMVRAERRSSPLPGALRLVLSPSGEVWAWSAEADPGEIVRVYPREGGGGTSTIRFPGPLTNVQWSGSELCAIERSGRCSILARRGSGYVTVFEYQCPGANAIAGTPRSALVGRSTLQRGEGSLLVVDRRTGETVPLRGAEGLVYELSYEQETDSVLSLEVLRETAPWSSLVRHSGAQYLETLTLLEYRGEDTGAAVARRSGGGEVYTSLGYAPSRIGSGGAAVRAESLLRAPRRIALGGSLLAGVNLDGSVTLWQAREGGPIADLYVFGDGEWVVLTGGEVYAASSGGRRHLATPGK